MKGQIEEFVSAFITGIIGIVIGINLVPTVQSAVEQASAATPQYAGLYSILTLLVVFSIIVFGAKFFLKK